MYGAEAMLGKVYFSKRSKASSKDSGKNFRETWRDFSLLKKLIKSPVFDKMVKDNIVKDKKIKSNTAIIKGTRISTNDITRMLADGYSVNDILKNVPTVKTDEQILAALVYEMRKWNFAFITFKYAKNNAKTSKK